MRLRNGVLGLGAGLVWALGGAAAASAAVDTVTNLHDSGAGSLRAMVAAAGAGDTVVFESGLTGTITLTGGPIPVDKSLTISGPGASGVKVDAGHGSRIFETLGSFPSISVSISGLTLADGAAVKRGGAILFEPEITAGEGSLTVTGATFTDDSAGGEGTSVPLSGQGDGGAILFETKGSLTVASSAFTGDTAGGNGGEGGESAQGDGGAIYASGHATVGVTDSSFSSDRAGGSGGIGESSAQGDGGAIEFEGEGAGSALTIAESSFSGNTAGGNGGAGISGGQADGGAIAVESGAITVTASTLNGNQAGGSAGVGPAGGEAFGGAIIVFGTSPATLTNDTIEGNSVGGPVGAASGGGVAGGGLWSEPPATLLNDTLDGNAVIGATGSGGNVEGSPGPITLKNTIVSAGAAAGGSNCGSNVTSAGHNLESTTPTQCGLKAGLGDLIGVNPLLGPLQPNGGPTQTQALLEGSPAIEAGENAGCPATDQRGVARPQPSSGRCDIGAFEFVAAPAPTVVTEAATGVGQTTATLNATVDPNGAAVTECTFEYGTTTGYGSSVPCATLPGSGTSPAAVSVALTGLVPSTEYHFRISATNGGGTSEGTDATMRTLPPTPPQPKSEPTPKPGGGSPPPVGIATTQKAAEELLLGCSKRELVLNDVLIRGGRVLLEGSAARSLDGKKVKIIFAGKKQVATTTVGSNGTFTTTAPLPPASVRNTNGARYLAESGKERSLNLKLARRLQLEPPKFSGGTVTLTGQVVPPLAKPVAPIDVDQTLECGKTTIVKKFTPPASGRFHVTLSVPAAAKAGIYRLSSTVRESAANKRGFPTFSLPLPVIL